MERQAREPNVERQAREPNGKEDEDVQGVTLLRLAEL